VAERTDRELLELAAKAAGITLRWIGDEASVPYTPEESAQRNGVDGYMWNPLTDDGDALRLAVKLRMDLIAPNESIGGEWGVVFPAASVDFDETADACPRRAIVRAAADIGAAK
jgi:hypothetical protein